MEGEQTTTPLNTFIGENGELKDGWKDAILPKEMQSEKIYEQIKDVKGAFSIIGNQAKLVGKKSSIPDEKSSEGDWNTFFETWGRPKTSEDYKLDVPEQYKDYFNDKEIKELKGVYHKIGLNSKQSEALWGFEKAKAERMDKVLKEMDETAKREAEGSLRQKWGTAYDENMHLVSRMINDNAGDLTEWLLGQYGNEPKLAEFLANIAKKFVEHRVITDIETPSNTIDQKIKTLMSDPAYSNAKDLRHKDLVTQVQRLFEEKNRLKQGQS